MIASLQTRRAVLLIAACWLVLAAADWAARFVHFGWHKTLWVSVETALSAPEPPMHRTVLEARRGGDLTRLLPGSEAYEQPRPPAVFLSDEAGLRNPPPTTGVVYEVVILGDSFMNAGTSMSNLFSARLARTLECPVYNYAIDARGPVYSMVRFWQDERFRARPPRWVVWGVLERNIDASRFGGGVTWIRKPREATASARVAWSQLHPRALQRTLPDSSLLAQLARRAWSRFQRHVEPVSKGDAVPGRQPVHGVPMLFLAETLERMEQGGCSNEVIGFAEAMRIIREAMSDRGMRLVVLLIPDKETVYADYLPDPELADKAGQCLRATAAALRKRHVEVVNLQPVFRREEKNKRVLYWGDDTHWNDAGIARASDELADCMQGLSSARCEP